MNKLAHQLNMAIINVSLNAYMRIFTTVPEQMTYRSFEYMLRLPNVNYRS